MASIFLEQHLCGQYSPPLLAASNPLSFVYLARTQEWVPFKEHSANAGDKGEQYPSPREIPGIFTWTSSLVAPEQRYRYFEDPAMFSLLPWLARRLGSCPNSKSSRANATTMRQYHPWERLKFILQITSEAGGSYMHSSQDINGRVESYGGLARSKLHPCVSSLN